MPKPHPCIGMRKKILRHHRRVKRRTNWTRRREEKTTPPPKTFSPRPPSVTATTYYYCPLRLHDYEGPGALAWEPSHTRWDSVASFPSCHHHPWRDFAFLDHRHHSCLPGRRPSPAGRSPPRNPNRTRTTRTMIRRSTRRLVLARGICSRLEGEDTFNNIVSTT